ncbi:UbiA family prenyltransferase [Streptomyces sp. NPDC047072]|uniref:UbiA family prenyltransferase n=1 Tax=Streptomyces sp. NPDC047072 TaxID=3154809 RepID=UPI003403BF91
MTEATERHMTGGLPVLRLARLCLAEARPQVQGIFLLRFAVGAVGALPAAADGGPAVVGAVAWWGAVVFAYLLNGVTDVAEDRANGSRRPIARGALPVRTAGWSAAAVAVAALGLSAAAGGGLVWWSAVFLALGWAYSAPPLAAKRWSLSCSVVVFGLGWTSYAAGAAAAGSGLDRVGLVFAIALSAWMALVGAVVKDLSDAGGDAVGGRRTLAARRGLGAARRLAVLGAVLVGVGGPVASLVWAPVALAGTLPLAAGAGWVVTVCVRTAGERDRHTRRGGYRAFMATQYAANLALLTALLVRDAVR